MDREHKHSLKLEKMLQTFSEQKERLTEFDSGEELDGGLAPRLEALEGFGLLSATQTFRDLGQEPGSGFLIKDGGEELGARKKTVLLPPPTLNQPGQGDLDARTTALSWMDRPRPRAQSDGQTNQQSGARRGSSEDELSQLVRSRRIVKACQSRIHDSLQALESAVSKDNPVTLEWVRKDLEKVQERLDDLEQMEGESWSLVAKCEGEASREECMAVWEQWTHQKVTQMNALRTASWEANARIAAADPTPSRETSRTRGHVEKVKLPTFSGRHEDFAEFQVQFQQLCRGEGYTDCLEMAQLRHKLPKEALAVIGGVVSPPLAWKRLKNSMVIRKYL